MTGLVLVSDTKKKIETCKGCVFDKGKEHCLDDGFIISSKHGFVGGCDNPKLQSGIFKYKEN
jgi:hypothetical protein